MSNKKLILISIIIAIILVVVALIFSVANNPDFFIEPQLQKVSVDETKVVLGDLESAHEHLTMLVFVDGARINFAQDKYMLKNEYAHFEGSDGTVIHKHSTGVTLPYFLSTLGIELTQNCITLDTSIQYCNSVSDKKALRVIVNGKEIENINTYELRHKDKVLINYGSDNDTDLQLKFNAISDVPIELL